MDLKTYKQQVLSTLSLLSSNVDIYLHSKAMSMGPTLLRDLDNLMNDGLAQHPPAYVCSETIDLGGE